MDILRIIVKVKKELDDNLKEAIEQDRSQTEYINSVNNITNKYRKNNIISTLNSMFIIKFTKVYYSKLSKQAVNNFNFTAKVLDNQNVLWFKDVLRELPFNSRRQYTQLVKDIELSMLNGDITRDQAVKMLNVKGTEFKVTLNNGKSWRFDVLMKRRLRDSIRTNSLRHAESLAQELNTNVFQVSEHAGARPLCSQDQGKLFSDTAFKIKDFRGNIVEVESWNNSTLGEPAGLFGYNCRHMKYPYAEGISIPDGEDDPLYSTDKHIDENI